MSAKRCRVVIPQPPHSISGDPLATTLSVSILHSDCFFSAHRHLKKMEIDKLFKVPAVSTGLKRKNLPDLPSAGESGVTGQLTAQRS